MQIHFYGTWGLDFVSVFLFVSCFVFPHEERTCFVFLNYFDAYTLQ